MAARELLSNARVFRGADILIVLIALLASAGAACTNLSGNSSNSQVTLIQVVPSNIKARDLDAKYVGTKDADSNAILLSVTAGNGGKHSQVIIVGADYSRLYQGLESRKNAAARKFQDIREKFDDKDFELWYNALTKGQLPSYDEFKRLEKEGQQYRDTMVKLDSELKGWNSLLSGDGTFGKLPDGSDLTSFVSKYVDIGRLASE